MSQMNDETLFDFDNDKTIPKHLLFLFPIFSSNIIQDLKEEVLDIPTELTEVTRAQQMLSKAQKEKEEYEETYLTRLPVTKAEKHRQKKLTTLGMFEKIHSFGFSSISNDVSFVFSGTLGDEITSFGDISALNGSGGQSKSKKRKSKATGKRGGKKRKFH